MILLLFIIRGAKIFTLALVCKWKSLYHYKEQEMEHIQLPYGDSALRCDGHISRTYGLRPGYDRIPS